MSMSKNHILVLLNVYHVFYWSFFALVFVANLFYKSYRIQQGESERAMEQEVADTVRDSPPAE